MSIPDPWEAVLLALAAWRSFYLLAHDDIFDRPRRYVTRLGHKWKDEGDPVPAEYRERLGEFIQCPFCLGFWIALAAWGAWLARPIETLFVAVPLALSAGVVAAQRFLSSE